MLEEWGLRQLDVQLQEGVDGRLFRIRQDRRLLRVRQDRRLRTGRVQGRGR
jgi:hypothetical protein